MATYTQVKYCPKCKKTVTADKEEKCKVCGSKVSRGKWIVQFWIEDFFGKKQKRLSGFETKREAHQAYIDFVKENENKKNISPEKLKFDHLYEEYKEFAKKRLKETSFYDFNSKCNIHILPYFKNLFVQDISPKILLKWQDSLNEYSYKYKRNIRSYLMAILNYAEKYYGIPNQLKNTDNFRNTAPKKEMQVWSPDEFNAFIQYVDKIEYKAFFLCPILHWCKKRRNSCHDLGGLGLRKRLPQYNKITLKESLWCILACYYTQKSKFCKKSKFTPKPYRSNERFQK